MGSGGKEVDRCGYVDEWRDDRVLADAAAYGRIPDRGWFI